MKNRLFFISFILFILVFISCSVEVSAASIYDGYECVDGGLKDKTTGIIYGSCVVKNDVIESCPTQALLNKYNISKIYSELVYDYNVSTDRYNLIINNVAGLYVRLGFDGETIPEEIKYMPNAQGTITITGLELGLKVEIFIYLNQYSTECADSLLGRISSNTPPYRMNALYNDKICVDYRNKMSSQATIAQRFVPECYEKDLLFQYERSEVEAKVNEAIATINNLSLFDTTSAKINLSCDFYGENNIGASKKPKYQLIEGSSYWDVICFESLIIKFDTPKALYAGESFGYWVEAEITKTCYPKWNGSFPPDPGGDDTECNGNNNNGDNSGKAYYPDDCRFATQCVVDNGGNKVFAGHAGPNDIFDSCVASCDGGKYSQACIDACYQQVYQNDASSGGRKLYSDGVISVRRLYQNATQLAGNNSSSSGIPFNTFEMNGVKYYTTNLRTNGWEGLDCNDEFYIAGGCYAHIPSPDKDDAAGWAELKLDDSQCANIKNDCYTGGGRKCLMFESRKCKGPNSDDYIQINGNCNGNTTCIEVLQNPSCLQGTGLDGNTSSSSTKRYCNRKCVPCESRGERVLNELQKELDEIHARLEDGEFVEYDDSHTSFRGQIIDSYTKKATVYSDNNGNPLDDDYDDDTLPSNIKGTEKIRYTWECEYCTSCKKGSRPSSSDNKDISATRLSTNSEQVSIDECEKNCKCSKWRSKRASRTFTIRQFSTVTTYRINLGSAYKSAVDGSTIYGNHIYQTLDSTVRQQFYYVGGEWYSNVFSPMINDWRKWPTYPGQDSNCLINKKCITKNDSSLTKNIIEYLHLGSWGQWEINLECFYGIINNFCVNCDNIPGTPTTPMGCNPKTDICDSGINYIFRRVDLDDKNMFPDRSARWNWSGTTSIDPTGRRVSTGAAVYDKKYMIDPEKLIDSLHKKGTSIYKSSNADTGNETNPELDYEIVLSKSNIKSIKSDIENNFGSWNTCTNGSCVRNKFDMDCTTISGRTVCKSKFLTNTRYLSVVKKPVEAGCNNLLNGRCHDF